MPKQKLDMQYSKQKEFNYEFRFATQNENIEQSRTIQCTDLYDLLRNVIACAGINFTAERVVVQRLYEHYVLGKDD